MMRKKVEKMCYGGQGAQPFHTKQIYSEVNLRLLFEIAMGSEAEMPLWVSQSYQKSLFAN